MSEECGQGITEYGAVITFVTLLFMTVLAVGEGTFRSAVTGSFASMIFQLHRLINGPG